MLQIEKLCLFFVQVLLCAQFLHRFLHFLLEGLSGIHIARVAADDGTDAVVVLRRFAIDLPAANATADVILGKQGLVRNIAVRVGNRVALLVGDFAFDSCFGTGDFIVGHGLRMAVGMAADFVTLGNEFFKLCIIGIPIVHDVKTRFVTVFVKDGNGDGKLVGKIVVKCKCGDGISETRPIGDFLCGKRMRSEEDGGGKRKNFFHDIPRKLNRTRLEILLFGNSENKRGNFVLYKKQRHRRFGLLDGDVLKIK